MRIAIACALVLLLPGFSLAEDKKPMVSRTAAILAVNDSLELNYELDPRRMNALTRLVHAEAKTGIQILGLTGSPSLESHHRYKIEKWCIWSAALDLIQTRQMNEGEPLIERPPLEGACEGGW
jgi:hypothetical protein